MTPDSVAPTLNLTLSRSGVDVTGDLCEVPLDPNGANVPGLTCTEVPDGSYDLAVTSTDPAVRIGRRCDDLASPVEGIVIGDFRSVSCRIVASRPGVVLGPDTVPSREAIPPVPPLALSDADGDDLTPGCETSSAGGLERTWCTGLAAGTYTATASFPEGYLGSVGCLASPTLDGGVGETPDVELSTEDWLWACVPIGPYAPLTITAGLARNEPAPDWLPGVAALVTSAGEDRSSACTTVRVWLETIPPPYVEIHCLGLDPATYLVSLAGVPVDVVIVPDCPEIVLPAPDPAFCSFGLGVPDEGTPEGGGDGSGSESATEDGSLLGPESDVLPPTGGPDPGVPLAVAGLTVIIGSGLVGSCRRRTRAATGGIDHG